MAKCGETVTGVVFNIQYFTVHDGPGLRTEIFLKGCPFRCKWCSNPESFKKKQEVGLYTSRCIGIKKCGLCLEACTEHALISEEDQIAGIHRDKCTNCMKCAVACPSNALQYWGKIQTVDEVMNAVLADKSVYKKSGGGVTLSGGEALMQWEFALEILKNCKKERIHTCVESALHCESEILDAVLPYTDLFITDIKHMDDQKHKEYTRAGNERTLNNIKKVTAANIPLIIRIPIIPEHNDDEENLVATADYILNELDNKVNQVQFLRYRRLGEEKYKSLNLDYPMSEQEYPDVDTFEQKIKNYVEYMKSRGIKAVFGSSSKMDFQ
ncbi:MAG: glycyl-radical enzyme activating protein [Lachnospiraceae bacterium]